MPSFYSNENFPRQVVDCLRDLGHDVLTVQEAGNAGRRIPDDEVLKYARDHGRAVLTIDRHDFIGLHQVNPDHLGIVVCKRDIDYEGQAQRIHKAVSQAGELTGQLIKVNKL